VPNNQYLSDWTGALSYDDNANLKTRAGWTFTYDAQNRLTSIQSGSTQIHYHYDPLNRIVARNINGTKTTQIWDNWNLIEERAANDAFQRMYLHGAAVNEVVGGYGPAYGDAFYFQDGRGNVTHVTGPGNNVIERVNYFVSGQPSFFDRWGNWMPGSSLDTRFLFQGALFVPGPEIYDMRNRFYHCNLGRFMQSDPIGFDAGDMNLFRYCGNDPVNQSDPTGLYVSGLTSFGGGEWIGNADGITNREIDLIVAARAAEAAERQPVGTGFTMAQVRNDGVTTGKNDSATKGFHMVPTKLSEDGKTVYPITSDHTGGRYEYQLTKDGKREGGAGYSILEILKLDPTVPNNRKADIKQREWKPLQSNGIFPDAVGLGFRPSQKANVVSVEFQTFQLRYNNQPVSVPTVLKHDVRYTNGNLRVIVTVVTP
jgi:RHS repeat-associated protein